MKLTFLGTGTSFGVPVIGCGCATCGSADPHDRRTRHGALLDTGEGRLLIDTPPELRVQLLREGIARVDAVWLTHTHADHVAGIDDLRIFSARAGQDLPTFIARDHADDLRTRFSYIFDPAVQPPEGTVKPRVALTTFGRDERIRVLGVDVDPVPVPHGPIEVYGFRCGPLGYVTDAQALPDDAVRRLEGVRVLVLNAVWFGRPHPTHLTVEEAVEAAKRVGAERTYLIHLTHRVRHQELLDRLPEGVLPAHDGLTIDL